MSICKSMMCCNNNGMQCMQISRIVTSKFDEHRKGKKKGKKGDTKRGKRREERGNNNKNIKILKYIF